MTITLPLNPGPTGPNRFVRRDGVEVGVVTWERNDGFTYACHLCGAKRRTKWFSDLRASVISHLGLTHPQE